MRHQDQTIERLELKYLIPEDTAEALRGAIASYCSPDAHTRAADCAYPLINLYLDTPSYAFYRARSRGDHDRIKLRVRSYGAQGPAYVEIKRKVVDVIAKQRAAVARDALRDAASGFATPLRDTPEQRKVLDAFASYVAQTGAEPTLAVRYEREAWVSEVETYARITFDRRITAQRQRAWSLDLDPDARVYPLDEAWRFDGLRSPVVLELKCETQVPRWMAELIERYALHRRGFSKYCFGLEALVYDEEGVDLRSLNGSVYV